MDLDLGTLCLLGILAVVVLMLIPRLMSAMGPRRYETPGDEYSHYDDETVRGRGAFGSPAVQEPEYDDPDIRSRGSFGSDAGTRSSGGLFRRSGGGSNRPRTNNPNVGSRGSFGSGRKD